MSGWFYTFLYQQATENKKDTAYIMCVFQDMFKCCANYPKNEKILKMFEKHFCCDGGLDLLFEHCQGKHEIEYMSEDIQNDRRQLALILFADIFKY